MAADQSCPPLGTGSVDMNALHDAAIKGEDLDKALEDATTRVEPLTLEDLAELPSLSGRTKAELLEIAEAEGVVADDSMTNAAITDAVQQHRDALTAPATDQIAPVGTSNTSDTTEADNASDAAA
jgi:hypothetical protein